MYIDRQMVRKYMRGIIKSVNVNFHFMKKTKGIFSWLL